MKKYTIKDLAEGRIAVYNDGSLAELKIILKEAFPNDHCDIARSDRYYYANPNGTGWLSTSGKYNGLAQQVKDFLFDGEFKWGEEVKVNYDNISTYWYTGTYIGYHPKDKTKHVVYTHHNDHVGVWPLVCKIPPIKEVSMQEIADKFGIPVDQLKIKK